MTVVVSDTGPLIALAKVGKLDLLRDLFGAVLIPPAVYRELVAKPGSEFVNLQEALQDYLKPTAVGCVALEVEIVTAKLDCGEQEAIALAYERKVLLLIDERLGRIAASKLGLLVTGVVGVLVQAK